jgi:flagellar M-ring protein FliF
MRMPDAQSEISKALEQMNEEVEQTAVESESDSEAEHELLEKVRAIVAADPKVAAHVIKQWMAEE